jgi:hypothetical protein
LGELKHGSVKQFEARGGAQSVETPRLASKFNGAMISDCISNRAIESSEFSRNYGDSLGNPSRKSAATNCGEGADCAARESR